MSIKLKSEKRVLISIGIPKYFFSLRFFQNPSLSNINSKQSLKKEEKFSKKKKSVDHYSNTSSYTGLVKSYDFLHPTVHSNIPGK